MERLFITNLTIKKVRHLKNISIPLSDSQIRHLVLTGKNGSGKTSVTDALAVHLNNILTDKCFTLKLKEDILRSSGGGLMVKTERSFPAPASLAEEAKKVSGRYDKEDVIQRLKEDFHNKCYICEMKGLQDPNVEHLLPHKNGKYPERKFDWENLFWSCGHCNGIKNNRKYEEGIMDCCKQDPEKYFYFQVEGDDVVVEAADPLDKMQERTALLIKEVFSMKNTGMRIYTSDEHLKLLQKEMSVLYKQLEKMRKNPTSKMTLKMIHSLLRRETSFAAFKRGYVRAHAKEYPELQEYVMLDLNT